MIPLNTARPTWFTKLLQLGRERNEGDSSAESLFETLLVTARAYSTLPGNPQRFKIAELPGSMDDATRLSRECLDVIRFAYLRLLPLHEDLPQHAGKPRTLHVPTTAEAAFIATALTALQENHGIAPTLDLKMTRGASGGVMIAATSKTYYSPQERDALIQRVIGNAEEIVPSAESIEPYSIAKRMNGTSAMLQSFEELREIARGAKGLTLSIPNQTFETFVTPALNAIPYNVRADLNIREESNTTIITGQGFERAFAAHQKALAIAEKHGSHLYIPALMTSELINHMPKQYATLKAAAPVMTDILDHHQLNGSQQIPDTFTFPVEAFSGHITAGHVLFIRNVIGDRYPNLDLPVDKSTTMVPLENSAFILLMQRLAVVSTLFLNREYEQADALLRGHQKAAEQKRAEIERETRTANKTAGAEAEADRKKTFAEQVGQRDRSAEIAAARAMQETAEFNAGFAPLGAITALEDRILNPTLPDKRRMNDGVTILSATDETEQAAMVALLGALAGTRKLGIKTLADERWLAADGGKRIAFPVVITDGARDAIRTQLTDPRDAMAIARNSWASRNQKIENGDDAEAHKLAKEAEAREFQQEALGLLEQLPETARALLPSASAGRRRDA